MEWTEETIIRLRELWTEGHSTAEIGRRLGVSKNAIVGKAHRLDLAARPSPIRREGATQEASKPTPRRLGPTLPPLASAEPLPVAAPVTPPAPVVPEPVVARLAEPVAPPPPRPVAAPPPLRVQSVNPRPYSRIAACCWPIGEPGTKSFRFCDDAAEAGKPYCGEHAKLAYVRVRDRREDAA